MLLSIIFYFTLSLAKASAAPPIDLFEPHIECTVIKVILTRQAFGFTQFPALYLSINNKPLTSKLLIGGREFKKTNPVSNIKTDNYEKISIISEQDNLVLELTGKPISRNGTLSLNGQILAQVTCH